MIQVLERAFAALTLLSKQDLGLTELADTLQLQKSTLHNILKSLETLGAVARTESGLYALGPKLIQLTEQQTRDLTLNLIAQHGVERLAGRIRQTVVVSVLRGEYRYHIANAAANPDVRVKVNLTEKKSPYNMCTGRILLAYLDEEALGAVVAARGMPGEEWPGIDSMGAMHAALGHIREEGITFDLTPDNRWRSMAVPVFGPDNENWAAMGVGMPEADFTDDNRERVIHELRNSSQFMSDSLNVAYGNFGPQLSLSNI